MNTKRWNDLNSSFDSPLQDPPFNSNEIINLTNENGKLSGTDDKSPPVIRTKAQVHQAPTTAKILPPEKKSLFKTASNQAKVQNKTTVNYDEIPEAETLTGSSNVNEEISSEKLSKLNISRKLKDNSKLIHKSLNSFDGSKLPNQKSSKPVVKGKTGEAITKVLKKAEKKTKVKAGENSRGSLIFNKGLFVINFVGYKPL